MENFNGILDKLRNDYCLNISSILEGRLKHIYHNNIGMDNIEEYIVYKLLKGHKPFFDKRDLYDDIIYRANHLNKKHVNMFVASNDISQEIVSLIINYSLHKSDVIIDFYWYSLCNKLSERFLQNKFNHNYLIKTNLNEIKYFEDKSSHYEIKKDIVEQVNIINGKFDKIPIKNNFFDIIYFADRMHHFSKHCVNKIIDELYRIIKKDGLLFTIEDNVHLFTNSEFLYSIEEERIYFYKEEVLIEDINFENAIKYYTEKKYDDALKILHRLKASENEIIDKYRLMLLIYTRINNIKKIRYLEKVLKSENIWNGDFDYILGIYYYSKMDYSLAMDYLKKAISKIENFVSAIYYIGLINLKMNKRQSSYNYFKKAYELIKSNNFYNPNLYVDTMSIEVIRYLLSQEYE